MELGDLREGILPGALLDIASEIISMSNVDLVGVGANLGCLNGTIPMAEELSQLSLYHELLELKFNTKIPYVSAGTSAALGLLQEGTLPTSVNQFRVGESILLGTDPVTGDGLRGLRDDVATVEAEIVELKEKRLVPSGDTGKAPFEAIELDEDPDPGQRGYRAIVTIGHVDTDVAGLTPIDSDVHIAGASSDVTVLNLGEDQNGLRLGDTVRFRPAYSAFVRLMNNPYSEVDLAGQALSDTRAPHERAKTPQLITHPV
jgi:predicted amino acid racemase